MRQMVAWPRGLSPGSPGERDGVGGGGCHRGSISGPAHQQLWGSRSSAGFSIGFELTEPSLRVGIVNNFFKDVIRMLFYRHISKSL